MTKSVKQINENIRNGNVRVVTAEEMTSIVKEIGPQDASREVDVVTTGTFGAMCSSGVWINFGHSDPPLKMSRVFINDVEAYAGVAAVDAYIGATQPSQTSGMEYGGAHVIEDLVGGKSVVVKARGFPTDCYPAKELETEVTLDELNQALMSNPRNAYQRYRVATNSSRRTLYTYMGKLLPGLGNATYSGAGALSPINNDPCFKTMGIGTRIFLCGGEGFIVGSGTQHDPEGGFSTLMVQGDLKKMSAEFLRAAVFKNYGCTLYVGMGVPIPVLDEDMARHTGVSDREILTPVLDYSVPSNRRPVLRKVSYEELKSGEIEIGGSKVKTSCLSSLHMARKIAGLLKDRIKRGDFFLTEPSERLPTKGTFHHMVQRKIERKQSRQNVLREVPKNQYVFKDEAICTHCTLCVSVCPEGVFFREEGKVAARVERCIKCDSCEDVCPFGAITLGVRI